MGILGYRERVDPCIFLIRLRVFHEVGTCGKDRSEQKDGVYHRPSAGFLP